MRVKLSYSVEAENVLKEVAKIINLQGDDLQEALNLFTAVQKELRGENGAESKERGAVNIHLAQEMLEDFRRALLNVDTRLEEASEIISGYDDYLRSLRTSAEIQNEGYTEPDVDPADLPEVEDE